MGMTDAERSRIVDLLAANPMAGDLIPGTGGCQKLRVARRGGGKSGGYRVVFFFRSEEMPIYLLTAYRKSDKGDLTAAERNSLYRIAKALGQ